MRITEEAYLAHYGILRRSGRYPWGSGADTEQRSRDFIGMLDELRKQGLKETDIAAGFNMTTTQLRAARSLAKNAVKQADIGMAQRLHDKGMSNTAIAARMGKNESSVRALLAPGEKDKADVLAATANMLKKEVAEKQYVDVGVGVEHHIVGGITSTKLKTAIARLKEEGYKVHYVKVQQLGTGKNTTLQVLVAPGTTYSDTYKNRDNIKQVTSFSEDGGRSYLGLHPPLVVNSKRIGVRYAKDGGADADGVIYVRPGVKDLSLGKDRYAQVRIAVDGTHYLKGMAMYKDGLPDGVDLLFNTNKSDTGNKNDAMKKVSDDPDNPFGSTVRQIIKKDANGKETVTSALNIVNDPGDWDKWSRSLSSQFLSKQSPTLAKQQLDMTYESRRTQYDDIMRMTNPSVRKKLLLEFAEGTDSAAVHLKAHALPRQKTHVILPINTLKETEVYAPNFNNGDRVVLVRFPHGGTFEIPELTVNNRHPEAKRLLGQAPNAIGINSKVASRLSGADFDGDTVLVIPNNQKHIKTTPPLEKLKSFDPVRAYPAYDGMPRMTPRTKGMQMGLVSNLITDMTVRGATTDELARAVRHSMVVIDAEKHHLNYKQSALDNGIPQLMLKYQGRAQGGASTVVSRRKSTFEVPERKARSAAKGGAIDKTTGQLVYEPTGATYIDPKSGKTIVRTTKVKKISEAADVNALSSGTPIERVYADHSNRLKQLANDARKQAVNTKSIAYSSSARVTYGNEVTSLSAKLVVAERNAPLERQAQVLANAVYYQKLRANPNLEASEKKKIKGQALAEMRVRTGAGKQRIHITDQEWAAIQAGAVAPTKLEKILANADGDRIKELASPKAKVLMTTVKRSRAESMLRAGYTQAEVAAQLGVSVSTLKASLGE